MPTRCAQPATIFEGMFVCSLLAGWIEGGRDGMCTVRLYFAQLISNDFGLRLTAPPWFANQAPVNYRGRAPRVPFANSFAACCFALASVSLQAPVQCK